MDVVVALLVLAAAPQVAAAAQCSSSQALNLLASHAVPTSCYSLIKVNGVPTIYDLTRVVSWHDGGSKVIKQMCGVDGSIGFFCKHSNSILTDTIEEGKMIEICQVTSGAGIRRLDRSRCTGGNLPASTTGNVILAANVMTHKTADDCWTSMEQGTKKIVLNLTKYVKLHPGGVALVVSGMCGKNSTASFSANHPFAYINEAIKYGYIAVLGTLSGAYETPPVDPKVLPDITADQLASHSSAGDCWSRIDHWVFDLTKLRLTHPSGDIILSCGQDLTSKFQNQHLDSYLGRMDLKGIYDGACVRNAQVSLQQLTSKACGGTSGVSGNRSSGGGGGTGTPPVDTTILPDITADQLASHFSAGDCWSRIDHWVFDLTKLRLTHPSGDILLSCGQDLTSKFQSQHLDSYLGRMDLKGIYDGACVRDANISLQQLTSNACGGTSGVSGNRSGGGGSGTSGSGVSNGGGGLSASSTITSSDLELLQKVNFSTRFMSVVTGASSMSMQLSICLAGTLIACVS